MLKSRVLALRLSLLGVSLLAACKAPHAPCELAPPELVARSSGLGFDAIATAALSQQRALFAWSSAEGLFVQPAGAAAGVAPTQIGARCRGGLDLKASSSTVQLACSRPDAGEAGEVALYELDSTLQVRSMRVLGEAGRDSRGVALALNGSDVHVAFHDGAIGEHAVLLASLRGDAVTLKRVSRSKSAASEPALLAHDGHVYLAFSELALPRDAQADASAAVYITRDAAPARQVLRTQVSDAAPTLAADARGLLLGYRDRKRKGARSELSVVRLDAQLRALGSPHTIGRANSEGAPHVYGCKQLTAALLPREYGSERFVGVNQLDEELVSIGAGHQFYTTGHDFVLASGACVADALLLFAADRAGPSKPGVEAHALRFSCGH